MFASLYILRLIRVTTEKVINVVCNLAQGFSGGLKFLPCLKYSVMYIYLYLIQYNTSNASS